MTHCKAKAKPTRRPDSSFIRSPALSVLCLPLVGDEGVVESLILELSETLASSVGGTVSSSTGDTSPRSTGSDEVTEGEGIDAGPAGSES